MVQTAPAAGTLTASGSNTFSFDVTLPVELMAEFELMDDVVLFGPSPMLLSMAGMIVRSGFDAELTSLSPLSISETEFPNEPLPPIPYTPPFGGNVLLDLVVNQLSVEIQGEIATTADGTLAQPPLPGDANLDGRVDISDLSILASHWQQSDRAWWHGDFSGDGLVNIADLSILASNWQAGVPAGAITASFAEALAMFDAFNGVVIPEPGLLSLTGLAVLLPGRASRRRAQKQKYFAGKSFAAGAGMGYSS